MTVLELEAKKAELARLILNDVNSEELVNELLRVIKKMIEKFPCMHSPEEVRASADSAVKAYREGDENRFITHEEMKKRHLV